MKNLQEKDLQLYNLILQEKNRQKSGLELIASENFTSKQVMECLGSVLTNKYSEGLPGARYYGGNEIIDKIENLCISRALETYKLSQEEWGVNVQPYSGSSANMAAYLGFKTSRSYYGFRLTIRRTFNTWLLHCKKKDFSYINNIRIFWISRKFRWIYRL